MRKTILIILSLLGWSSLGGRLYLKIVESEITPLESTLQFFSYFTIVTTLLVSIYFSKKLFSSSEATTFKFEHPEDLTAITIFALIVGIVYHIVQKPLWNPEGIDLIIDTIHHTLIPIGTLTVWLMMKNKEVLDLKRLFKWLLYPVLYVFFVLMRGYFSNFYPYAFMNVGTLGLAKVMLNLAIILVLSTALMLIFFLLSKRKQQKT